MKPVIFLDLDGTTADMKQKAIELFGDTWLEELESPGWGKFANYPNFYEMLDPMPDALELYEGCCEITGDRNLVQILTAIPNRAFREFPNATKHKIEWARRHLHPKIRVTVGPFAQDKQYHATPGDVLVDDMELNIVQWNAAGGFGIVHTSAKQSLLRVNDFYNTQHLKKFAGRNK